MYSGTVGRKRGKTASGSYPRPPTKALRVSNKERRLEINPWQNPTNFIPFTLISSRSSWVKFVSVISCVPGKMNVCMRLMFVVWRM